jgi:hypothetical protein
VIAIPAITSNLRRSIHQLKIFPFGGIIRSFGNELSAAAAEVKEESRQESLDVRLVRCVHFWPPVSTLGSRFDAAGESER